MNVTTKDDPVEATVNAFNIVAELPGECVVHAQCDPVNY